MNKKMTLEFFKGLELVVFEISTQELRLLANSSRDCLATIVLEIHLRPRWQPSKKFFV